MQLLIVEEGDAFRGFLLLWTAEQAGKNIPDIFEAATLGDALRILRDKEIDAVLCDEDFPPDWGDRIGGPPEWRESSVTLRKECLSRIIPFVLLRGNALAKLLMARSAIDQVLALASRQPSVSAR
ncbi:MAG: hypothetical protein ACREFU_13585 [Acetobacteraceae bacterium]